ncbi:MAG: hypothetical protein JWN63_1731 [Candidatus Acidoferrum typicum]|nr:hypothetical protein [Candidatus Acidoferrum typicum]
MGLEEQYLDPEDDIGPQSLQPVIFTNDDGERQIELMRWAFKLPDRLLFNARSEGIELSKFWKEAFLTGRCIVINDEQRGSVCGLHSSASALVGRVKQKLAPRGELLAAHKWPPCDSIMERLIRSPMPVP